MQKIKIDSRTLETQLRNVSGIEFCTIRQVQAVTNMSYKQVQARLKPLAPLPHTKPYRYLIRHVAQILTAGNPA